VIRQVAVSSLNKERMSSPLRDLPLERGLAFKPVPFLTGLLSSHVEDRKNDFLEFFASVEKILNQKEIPPEITILN